MSKYLNFFSTYEMTDPPPIQSNSYVVPEDNTSYNYSYIPQQYTAIEQQNNNNEEQNSTSKLRIYNPLSIHRSSSIDTKPSLLNNVVDEARKYIGTNYQWGGSSPKTGFDCSGLIQYVYKKNGINLPRTVKELENFGTEVKSLSDVKVGDLICTPGSGQSGKHVKMVSRINNGQIYTIEAKGKKLGIIESPLNNTSNITTIRRVYDPSDQQLTRNEIIKYFINKGLTENQARGIYGNIMQESSGNPKAVSKDGYNSYGLAQWTGSRKTKLFSMYGSNPTSKQQLDFLWYELNSSHKDALNSLKQTTTVSQATKVFMDKFEKPHKDYANFSSRLKYAQSLI